MPNINCSTKTLVRCAVIVSMLGVIHPSAVFALSEANPTPASQSAPQPSKRTFIYDIAVDPDGSIYVLDNDNDQVLKLDKDGKALWRTALSAPGQLGSNSYKLVRSTSGRNDYRYFIVSNQAGLRAIRSDGSIESVIPSVGAFTDRIMGTDGFGALYFPNTQKHRVEVYTIITTNVSPDQLGASDLPKTIALADPGPYFPKDYRGNCIKVIDGRPKGGPVLLSGPHWVEVEPSGSRVWVSDKTYAFHIFDGSGKFLREVHAPDKKNRSFTSIAAEWDKDGNLYLACQETRAVLKYDHDGKLLKTIPSGFNYEGFGLDADGNLYIGDNDGYNLLDGTGRCFPAIKVLDQTGKQTRLIPLPLD